MMNFHIVAATELSDSDLRALLPDIVITQYNELEDKSLGQLLNDKGQGIILFVQEETRTVVSGHWLAICRVQGGVLLFDPYGGKKDPWFLAHTWVSEEELDALDQETPILSEIVRKAGLRPVYNPDRLQKMKKGIETCGRHCVVRLWNQHQSSAEYSREIRAIDGDPDLTVCRLTFDKLGR